MSSVDPLVRNAAITFHWVSCQCAEPGHLTDLICDDIVNVADAGVMMSSEAANE